jgi:hypothetical protein
MWPPEDSRRKTCQGCHERRIKCLVGKVPVSNRAERVRKETGAKRVKVSKPVIVDSGSEVEACEEKVAVRKPRSEQTMALWSIAAGLESRAKDAASTRALLREIRDSMSDIAHNTEILAAAADSFANGKRFLRTREMGAPERPEEERVWGRSSSGSEGSGREPEEDGMEVDAEVEAEVEATLK